MICSDLYYVYVMYKYIPYKSRSNLFDKNIIAHLYDNFDVGKEAQFLVTRHFIMHERAKFQLCNL